MQHAWRGCGGHARHRPLLRRKLATLERVGLTRPDELGVNQAIHRDDPTQGRLFANVRGTGAGPVGASGNAPTLAAPAAVEADAPEPAESGYDWLASLDVDSNGGGSDDDERDRAGGAGGGTGPVTNDGTDSDGAAAATVAGPAGSASGPLAKKRRTFL